MLLRDEDLWGEEDRSLFDEDLREEEEEEVLTAVEEGDLRGVLRGEGLRLVEEGEGFRDFGSLEVEEDDLLGE